MAAPEITFQETGNQTWPVKADVDGTTWYVIFFDAEIGEWQNVEERRSATAIEDEVLTAALEGWYQ